MIMIYEYNVRFLIYCLFARLTFFFFFLAPSRLLIGGAGSKYLLDIGDLSVMVVISRLGVR